MRVAGAGVAVCGALLLSGCVVGTPRPTATVTITASTPPTTAPSSGATSSPTPSTGPSGEAAGCASGSGTIPAGADTAALTAVDVDGDGLQDTEFYSSSPIAFGVARGAGGVVLLPDDLAGPAAHSGWIAAFDSAVGRLAVLDDGRTASLHAFVDCRFVTTRGVDGKPYTFTLNGFGTAGTGVACNDRNGGTLLEGVDAVRRADGRYDIRWTQIDVSADGTTATNGATETRWSGLAADDPRVRASMESHCGDAPKVRTDGR